MREVPCFEFHFAKLNFPTLIAVMIRHDQSFPSVACRLRLAQKVMKTRYRSHRRLDAATVWLAIIVFLAVAVMAAGKFFIP